MKKKFISITDNNYLDNIDSLLIKAEGLMVKNYITQIPVIDNDGKILKIISKQDIDKSFGNCQGLSLWLEVWGQDYYL